MKFQPMLHNTHDLKKQGYKLITKLHKLEKKRNLNVYDYRCNDDSFVFLSIQQLAELINLATADVSEKKEVKDFYKKTENFLVHLKQISENGQRINAFILSSYLKAYTKFFNCALEYKLKLNFSNEISMKWTVKCVSAYYAAWRP